MFRIFQSRPFRLWLLILAFLGVCLEVGHLTGRFEPRFLDGLFPQASWWWDQPVRPHVFAAVVLLTIVAMMARRLLPAVRLLGAAVGPVPATLLIGLGCALCLDQLRRPPPADGLVLAAYSLELVLLAGAWVLWWGLMNRAGWAPWRRALGLLSAVAVGLAVLRWTPVAAWLAGLA